MYQNKSRDSFNNVYVQLLLLFTVVIDRYIHIVVNIILFISFCLWC